MLKNLFVSSLLICSFSLQAGESAKAEQQDQQQKNMEEITEKEWAAMSCSQRFEYYLDSQKSALPKKALLIGLAGVFAFPVGFSATSIEAANYTNVVLQSQAYRVLKEAYIGQGAYLDKFAEDVKKGRKENKKEELTLQQLTAKLIDLDQKTVCSGHGGWFPTKQVDFTTYGQLVDLVVE